VSGLVEEQGLMPEDLARTAFRFAAPVMLGEKRRLPQSGGIG
jgi:hypothetical protein